MAELIDDTGRMMLHILSIDPQARLEFSDWTKKWFIQSRIYLHDGTLATGVTEHADLPDEAVQQYFQRLISIDPLEEKITVGLDAGRREYIWNGAAFAETHESRKR